MAHVTSVPAPSAGSGTIPPIANYLYVSPLGSDVTGDGSIAKPFANVSHAMSVITTNAPTVRWGIWITGRINDLNPIVFKPNVFIVGVGPQQARIAAGGAGWSLDASWAGAGDHRSGFIGCTVSGAQNWDFNAVTSNEGKLYAQNAWINNTFTFTRFLSVNQCTLDSCRTFTTVSLNGGQFALSDNNFEGAVNVGEGPGNADFHLQSHGNRYAGGLNITQVASAGSDATLLGGDWVPTLTVSGVFPLQATADAIPATPTLLGGATLTRLTQSSSLQYAAGTTAARPAADLITPGYSYLDTTIVPSRPIFWTGVAWIDATGTVV
jgi:hypothetical protein